MRRQNQLVTGRPWASASAQELTSFGRDRFKRLHKTELPEKEASPMVELENWCLSRIAGPTQFLGGNVTECLGCRN